ncbi:hypothetical protein [Virgibacillus sediminis]|uniref:OmpR/PhoB-type domain-containing protein n=1 Tax=Virgibacillus sediminis TaxID=202260 RepID=A0ABV7A4J1_9BACI
MPRGSELTEEELLEKEDAWWNREDEGSIAWFNEGVWIFQRLSIVNRQEIRYKETLANLLLNQGEDFKLKQQSYEKAIPPLKQVVRLDPDHSRAYYRLGFLYFYKESWTNSIDAFQQALSTYARKESNRLNKLQQLKAHHYILKATQIILNEGIEKVEKIPVEDLDLFQDIKDLLKEVKAGRGSSEHYPYQMAINGTEMRNLSEEEYEELSDPFRNEHCFILNQQSMNDTFISLYGREVRITKILTPLLEYLMQHPGGVQSEVIIQRRQRPSNSPEAMLRQDIRRLRLKLSELDPALDLIESIDGGYRWNCLQEYRIFKHNRDVTSEMLMD